MRWGRVLAASLVLLVCFSSAHAAGLRLSWEECPEGNGQTLKQSSCNAQFAIESLVSSMELSAPVDSVIGMEIVIDLVSDSATLPDWWRYEPGGCNAGTMSASGDFSALGACGIPWNSTATGLVQAWWGGQPRGGANQARLIFTVFVSPTQKVSLDAATPYYAGIVRLTHSRSSGANACAGCTVPVCLVLNSVQLLRLPGASVEAVQIVNSGGTGNWASWQGTTADCNLVPVRNRTWGAIKSSYR